MPAVWGTPVVSSTIIGIATAGLNYYYDVVADINPVEGADCTFHAVFDPGGTPATTVRVLAFRCNAEATFDSTLNGAPTIQFATGPDRMILPAGSTWAEFGFTAKETDVRAGDEFLVKGSLSGQNDGWFVVDSFSDDQTMLVTQAGSVTSIPLIAEGPNNLAVLSGGLWSTIPRAVTGIGSVPNPNTGDFFIDNARRWRFSVQKVGSIAESHDSFISIVKNGVNF